MVVLNKILLNPLYMIPEEDRENEGLNLVSDVKFYCDFLKENRAIGFNFRTKEAIIVFCFCMIRST